MKKKLEKFLYRPAAKTVTAGIAAALLIGGKEALAAIPNVEIVTLLCAVYGFVIGPLSLVSVLAFVTCEGAIYGFGSWTVSYYIYWPLVTAVFILLRHILKRPRIILPTVAAVILTAFFSVLTSLVDIGLLSGFFTDFWKRFAVYYSRGIIFYVIQICCNLALFSVLFVPLSHALGKCLSQIFLNDNRYVFRTSAGAEPAPTEAPPSENSDGDDNIRND